MSYLRDTDRHTRGVGAIAAADNAGRARRVRQAIVSRRTQARDRAMSAIAQGALGRIPLRNEGRDTTYITPPAPAAIAQPTGGGRQGNYIPPATTTAPPYMPPPSIPPPIAVIPPPVDSPPPTRPPILNVPPTLAPSGGGGSSTTGVVPGSPSGQPPIPLPEIGPLPTEPEAGGNPRTLLLVGGLALAALWVFRRRDA